jgi:hypothetical protein
VDQKTVEDRRLSGREASRLRVTKNDPSGVYQAEALRNSLADSAGFCILPDEASAGPRSFRNAGDQLTVSGQV